MLAGIREVLVITTPNDSALFKSLLGDGSQIGISIEYAVQNQANGLAEAFLIGENFISNEDVALILGDNIFHGVGLGRQLSEVENLIGAQIFAYEVNDPERYGVVEFDRNGSVVSIEEKPKFPKSNFVVPGLYFYNSSVVDVAREVAPSARGELEITSVNEFYLREKKLHVQTLERGTTWLDTGTFESLHTAASYVRIIEERQGTKISCLEEIAWRNGWISDLELGIAIESYRDNDFANYLTKLISGKPH
jgi:glucose-1-phosphate thymidylyltransferase